MKQRMAVDGVVMLLACLVFSGGCASTLHQRGWVGGEFKEASRWSWWPTIVGPAPDSVIALPNQVATNQKRAVLVSRLFTNTPAANAGIREGDLIVAVNGAPVESLDAFRKTVGESSAGTVLTLGLFREGKTQETKLCVGRECYRRGGYFAIVLPFPAPELSLEPLEPRLSILGVVSFKRRTNAPELWSPTMQYWRTVALEAYHSQENMPYVPGKGWDLGLGVLWFRLEDRILKQESAPN